MKSRNEMEELKRFRGSTSDGFSRRKLIEDRDIILEFTAKIQELQNEFNCMNDSRDFKEAESVRSGLSHVPSQAALLPFFRDLGGMLSRSLGMPSRNDRPPSIWDTHGISGNVFANPTASSSALYPQESSPWISHVSEHTSPHVMGERQTPVLDSRCQSGPSARNSFNFIEGRVSKNYVADQQRLLISDLHFDKFLNPATFACWKIRFQIEVFAHNFIRNLCCGSRKWRWSNKWMISKFRVLLKDLEHQILKYSTRKLFPVECSTDISAVSCWSHCLWKKVAGENVRSFGRSQCMNECRGTKKLGGIGRQQAKLGWNGLREHWWPARTVCFAGTLLLVLSFSSTLSRGRKSRLCNFHDESVAFYHAVLDEDIWVDLPRWEEHKNGVVGQLK